MPAWEVELQKLGEKVKPRPRTKDGVHYRFIREEKKQVHRLWKAAGEGAGYSLTAFL